MIRREIPEICRKLADIYYQRGNTKGDPNLAIRDYTIALTLTPDTPEIQKRLKQAQQRLK